MSDDSFAELVFEVSCACATATTKDVIYVRQQSTISGGGPEFLWKTS